MNTRLNLSIALALLAAGHAAGAQSNRNVSDGSVGRDPDISAIAADAYIFGYPLVSMYVTKRLQTNVATPTVAGKAPLNQVGSLLAFPTPSFRNVVAPDVNTLSSIAWLDLSTEPIVIHMPDTRGRYYVMSILDMWTEVIGSPGKRTTGTKAQEIAVVGPNWKGTTPSGITTTIHSRTNTVMVLNRIQANGAKDVPAVNALQRRITTKPLSSFGRPHQWPPGNVDFKIDRKASVREQVNRMTADQFFTTMAEAMKNDDPLPEDAAIVARMARIGLRPGVGFDPGAALAGEIGAGAGAGLEKIEETARSHGRVDNGWMILPMCGKYGAEYLTRAVVAFVGLGCNLPEDAFNPATRVDSDGKTLSGANRYLIHFPAGQEPPVRSLWSITMYDRNYALVATPINRSAVSSWYNLKKNVDGSTDIYVQHASPSADKVANWLPAPAGDFVLVMRLYWPKESAISGSWKPPAVKRLD